MTGDSATSCQTIQRLIGPMGKTLQRDALGLRWTRQGEGADRGRESASSPSLRTGQALFTHPALQLMGSNSETEVFEF